MFSIVPLGCQEKRGSVFAQRGMNGLMAERRQRIKRSVKVLARLLPSVRPATVGHEQAGWRRATRNFANGFRVGPAI